MTTAEGISAAGVYRLAVWLSPAFPVGAYTYSSGIEHAVEGRLVADADSLFGWVAAMLRVGQGRVDADFFRDAYAAMRAGDDDDLVAIAELADAMQRSVQMGRRLGVDDDDLAAGGVALQQPVGVGHHEVRLELDTRVAPGRCDHVGPERQVRHEDPVHHVPLDAVDSRHAQCLDLCAEGGEVGRQHRRHRIGG